ncbi:MAG: hypothetical protein Q7W30_05885 [Coriobacteriia bacterium]|nr:hypothetical protein [Coriobacteriia bacterium]
MTRRSRSVLCASTLIAILFLWPAAAFAGTTTPFEQRLATGYFSSMGPIGGGVSGSRVVYSDTRLGNTDIYCYDLSTGVETRITDESAAQYSPAISGTTIVWEDRRDWGTDSRIYAYDLVTKTEKLISKSPSAATNPAISGRNVVWQADHEHGGDGDTFIYVYNLDTGTQRRLLASTNRQTSPSIDGQWVVWQDASTAHSDVWLCRLDAIPVNLTTGASAAIYPAVSGGRVAWIDYRNGSPEIYAYDADTGVSKRVTNDAVAHDRPAISGGKVVWSDTSNGNSDVFVHDIYSGSTKPLSLNASSQGFPWISGSAVVWQDTRSGAFEIYACELNTPRITASIVPVIAYNGVARAVGSLVTAGGTPLAGRDVFVEWSYDGSLWFAAGAPSGKTDAAGRFSVASPPMTFGVYVRATYPGDAEHLSAQSASTRVKPRASLGTPVAPSTMYHSKSYAVYGSLAAKHPATSAVGRLYCYRLESGHWRLRKSFPLTATDSGANSRYNATVKLPYTGTWRMRAYHSDYSHAPTYSAWRTVKVK